MGKEYGKRNTEGDTYTKCDRDIECLLRAVYAQQFKPSLQCDKYKTDDTEYPDGVVLSPLDKSERIYYRDDLQCQGNADSNTQRKRRSCHSLSVIEFLTEYLSGCMQ